MNGKKSIDEWHFERKTYDEKKTTLLVLSAEYVASFTIGPQGSIYREKVSPHSLLEPVWPIKNLKIYDPLCYDGLTAITTFSLKIITGYVRGKI